MRAIRKKILSILLSFALVLATLGQIPSQSVKAANDVNVCYRTHIQTYGWEGEADKISTWKKDGDMSGTSGKAKRLEGIEIAISGNADLGIQYTTHCQTYGWLPWSSDGEMNGTEGEAKRLEAIKIQLTGSAADKYDVYYRVHAQTYGWLFWARNGQAAGTAGLGKRLEGIQVVIVPKGNAIPNEYKGIVSTNTKSYISSKGAVDEKVSGANSSNVLYKTHVQTFGWQGWRYNGKMSGTSGLAKRLEGISIKLTNKQYDGGITYRTHVQTYGWQGWVSDGAMSGTSGEAKRLESIQIYLTGEMAKHYDIYYRVHAQTFGWLGWVKNGEPAGTAGFGKRLEGIHIVLVDKNAGVPGAVEGIESVSDKGFEYASESQIPENPYVEPVADNQNQDGGEEQDGKDDTSDSSSDNNDQSEEYIKNQELLNTLPDEVKLYFVGAFEDKISIPEGYPTSYQLDLSAFEELPEFKIGGGWSYERGLVDVTESGLISMKEVERSFAYGVWVNVTYGGTTKKINVVACDYADIYEEEKVDEISKQFQTGYDNDYDRYVAITKYVAENYNYNARYSTTLGIIVNGGADCIGNASLIIDICKKCGIDARERNGNRDLGGLGGHKNAIAKINGEYYVAEAGTTGTAPRSYFVKEEKDGYLIRSMDGERLMQYSGFEEHAILPDTVEKLGYEVPTSHVYGYWGGVFTYSDVKEVTISASIKEIAPNTFTAAEDLENIYVDEENDYFTDVDGVLYSKDKQTLIAMPENHDGLKIEEGTKVISRYAFRDCGDLKNVLVIPEGVTTLEDYSFLSYAGKVEIPSSVTYISDSAFLGDDYTADYCLPRLDALVIIGDKGSYAEEYANKLGITFLNKGK